MSLSVSRARARRLYQKASARRLSSIDVTFMLALEVQRLSSSNVPEANATFRPVLPFTPTMESAFGSMRSTGAPSSLTSIGPDHVLPPSTLKRILLLLAWLTRQSTTRRQGPSGVPVMVITGGDVPLEDTAPMAVPVIGTRSDTTTGTPQKRSRGPPSCGSRVWAEPYNGQDQ